MPEMGDVMSMMPGHRAVFRGEYVFGCPVYETEIPPALEPDSTQFQTLIERLHSPDAPIVFWNEP